MPDEKASRMQAKGKGGVDRKQARDQGSEERSVKPVSKWIARSFLKQGLWLEDACEKVSKAAADELRKHCFEPHPKKRPNKKK